MAHLKIFKFGFLVSSTILISITVFFSALMSLKFFWSHETLHILWFLRQDIGLSQPLLTVTYPFTTHWHRLGRCDLRTLQMSPQFLTRAKKLRYSYMHFPNDINLTIQWIKSRKSLIDQPNLIFNRSENVISSKNTSRYHGKGRSHKRNNNVLGHAMQDGPRRKSEGSGPIKVRHWQHESLNCVDRDYEGTLIMG